MTRRTYLSITAFLAALLVTLLGSQALGLRVGFQDPPVRTGCGHDEGICSLKTMLNLSEEQAAPAAELEEAFRSRRAQVGDRIHRARARLSMLLLEPEDHRQAIEARVDELAELQKELQLLVVDHLLALKKILTAEQQKELFSMLTERMCPGGLNGHGCKERCGNGGCGGVPAPGASREGFPPPKSDGDSR